MRRFILILLSGYSFANNKQSALLNQRKRMKGHKTIFKTKSLRMWLMCVCLQSEVYDNISKSHIGCAFDAQSLHNY